MINKNTQVYEIGCGLELLDELHKDTATLVILDLPYYGVVNEDWDNAWKSLDDYLDWCQEWFIKVERVLKPSGSLYYFNSQFKVIKAIDTLIEDVTNLKFRQFITIDKGLQSVAGRTSEALRTYPNATEYISIYNFENVIGNYLKKEIERANIPPSRLRKLFPTKTNNISACTTNWILGYSCPSEIQYSIIKKYLNTLDDNNYLSENYYNLINTFNSMVGFTDVWGFDFYKDKRHSHPTQKPFELIERIVLTSSNEGDLVVDPAMGTGTTYKVCKSHNRNFRGRELNSKYESDIIAHAMPLTPTLEVYA